MNQSSETGSPHQVAVTTTDSQEAADDLASGIVRERLAACVQIVGPVTSVYRWDGDVQRDAEWQLWIKTAGDRLDDLGKWLAQNHEYDVPELVAMSVTGGSAAYLSWVTDETRPARR